MWTPIRSNENLPEVGDRVKVITHDGTEAIGTAKMGRVSRVRGGMKDSLCVITDDLEFILLSDAIAWQLADSLAADDEPELVTEVTDRFASWTIGNDRFEVNSADVPSDAQFVSIDGNGEVWAGRVFLSHKEWLHRWEPVAEFPTFPDAFISGSLIRLPPNWGTKKC